MSAKDCSNAEMALSPRKFPSFDVLTTKLKPADSDRNLCLSHPRSLSPHLSC